MIAGEGLRMPNSESLPCDSDKRAGEGGEDCGADERGRFGFRIGFS